MNTQGITIMENGQRTTGIEQFFTELPSYIIALQKGHPPYMPFAKGYGYIGVTLVDTDKDRVQCHICGRWYKALGKHITIHDIKADEYKDMVGLYRKEPLMSLGTLQKFRSANKIEIANQNLAKGREMLRSGLLKDKAKQKSGSKSDQFKNRYGTCDAQLKYRLDKAIEKYKRTPTTDEEPLLANILSRRFGSWSKALNFYGYPIFNNPKLRDIESEKKIAPKCKSCGISIERKEFPSGPEDKVKWLNKKTCAQIVCMKKYRESKISFRGCSFEGCTNIHKAMGLCMKHYLSSFKKNRNH